MIAPFLIAALAVPVLIAFWLVAWLWADVFAGPYPATVRERSDIRPR